MSSSYRYTAHHCRYIVGRSDGAPPVASHYLCVCRRLYAVRAAAAAAAAVFTLVIHVFSPAGLQM